MSLYAQAVVAERAAKIARDMADHEAGHVALREENKRLRTALLLLMECAGDINSATDTDLEAALECGAADTERQANAWLVARAALKMPNDQAKGPARSDGPA